MELVRRSAARQEQDLRFALPCDPSRLLEARQRIRHFLHGACDDGEWVDDVVLAVEEACTNAIRHSGSSDLIDVSLQLDERRVVVAVHDRGQGLSAVRPDFTRRPEVMQPGGRGLFLIHELVDELDFSMDGGLEVRMTKALPAEMPAPVVRSGGSSRRPHAGWRVQRQDLFAAAAFVAIAILIAVFDRLEIDGSYAPPTLLAVLNLVFLGAAPVFVAAVAARSYLTERSSVILLLGCGNLALAAGAVGSGLHLGGADANAFITVYATAAAGAAVCWLASAVLGLARAPERRVGGRWTLFAAYGTVAASAAAVVALVRFGVWPVYFVTGSGHTVLSKTLLWTATVMFAVSAVLLAGDWGRGRSVFRRWYSLGLALIAVGLAAVSLQQRLGDPLNWIGRSSQYLGAMTMAVAVVAAARRSGAWRLPLGRSLRESAGRYQRLVEVSPDAILVHAAGVYVFANPAAVALFGADSPGDLVGRAVLDLVPHEDRALLALRVEQSYQDDAALLTHLRVLRLDGRPVDVEVRGARVQFEGRPAAQIVLRDVTERRQAEAERERLLLQQDRLYEELAEKERLSSALNGIAAAITKLVDPQEILTRVVAQVAVAVGAESGTISLVEKDRWVPAHGWGIPDELLGVPIPRAEVPYAEEALESREVVVVDDCETDPRVDRELQRLWGVRAVMVAPLVMRDNVVAGLFLNHHSAPHHFTPAEADFAGKASALISSVLENARLYQDERGVADQLQAALLAMPAQVDGADFACEYHAATETAMVGGDFYDVFELEYGLLGLTVGDISGKGLDAAIMTSLVKNTLRAQGVEKGKTPAEAMRIANEVLLGSSAADVFATVFFGLLDLRDGRLVYTNAGHPPPALLRADGVGELLPNSPLVGGLGDAEFATSETWLEKDDVLILYTDGLTEARSGTEQFGQARLFALIAELRGSEPAALVQEVRRRVVDFAGGQLQDDLAMLAVQRSAAPTPSQVKLLFDGQGERVTPTAG